MKLSKKVFSAEANGDGFAVLCDGKPLSTPNGAVLRVPSRALAEAIAGEFAAQGPKPDVRTMPLTQLALTALDKAPQPALIEALMRFGETELICQRATHPSDLVAEEEKTWQPYLDWCRTRFNAELRTGEGIVPFRQNPEALAALRAFIGTLPVFSLVALSEACHALGSLVLGLALFCGSADSAQAVEAAEVERIWQNRKWGEDPELQARRGAIERELATVKQWLELLARA